MSHDTKCQYMDSVEYQNTLRVRCRLVAQARDLKHFLQMITHFGTGDQFIH